MTTQSLSARIAALEEAAALADAARQREQALLARITEMQHELAEARAAIRDGEYARRVLNHLAAQADQVLSGGEAAPATALPRLPLSPLDVQLLTVACAEALTVDALMERLDTRYGVERERPAVRAALDGLKKCGCLTATRQGRNACYALSSLGETQLDHLAQEVAAA